MLKAMKNEKAQQKVEIFKTSDPTATYRWNTVAEDAEEFSFSVSPGSFKCDTDSMSSASHDGYFRRFSKFIIQVFDGYVVIVFSIQNGLP